MKKIQRLAFEMMASLGFGEHEKPRKPGLVCSHAYIFLFFTD